MDQRDSSFYAKFIWRLVNGHFKTLTLNEAYGALNKVFTELKDGILHFYIPSADVDATTEQIPESLHGLVCDLSTLSGLDVVQTWGVITNYLKHELRGSAKGLKAYLTDESRMAMLVSDICVFHWNDRLFRLKCVNVILTYYEHENHEYRAVFKALLLDNRQFVVMMSQIEQLKRLVNTGVPVVRTHGRIMTPRMQIIWLSYNLREQLEVLHNILLCIENGFLSRNDCLELLPVIQNHAFGSDVDAYGNLLNDNHKEVLEQIAHMETIVVIRAFQTLEKGQFVIQNLLQLERFIDEIKHLCLPHSSLIHMFIKANIIATTERKNRNPEVFIIQAECLQFLDKMLNHKMFQVPALYAKIAYYTAHDMIQMLADISYTESFQQISEFYGIAKTLLCNERSISLFFGTTCDSALQTLFTGAVRCFPRDHTLVTIVESLSACGPEYINCLQDMLSNLPTYLEVLTEERVALMDGDGDKILANINYKPFKYTGFIIPRGTVGTIVSESPYEVIWICKFNFFFVLQERLIEFRTKIRSCPAEITEEEILEIVSYFKILSNFLKSKCTLSEDIVICIDSIFPLLDMFAQNILNFPTALTAACLECAVALHRQYPNEVYLRLERLRLVPALNLDSEIKEETVASVFKSLPPSVVVTAIVSKECLRGEYPLLKAYFLVLQKILREPSVEVKDLNVSSGYVDTKSVEKSTSLLLPAIICMLRDIFPNIHAWYFKEEEERENMMLQCLHIIHWLLGTSPDTLENDPSSSVSMLHSLCIYSLLYTPSGKTLLKVVATGEPHIQAIMEKELSWTSGRSTTLIHLIHLALSILNRVILAKMNMQKSRYSCALEYEMYLPERSRFQVPLVVANYIFNCFNPNLRTMAVVVLKRFAQDKPKTLLSFLSLDPSMIRFMFIRPLLSSLESDNLKVTIMQLITLSLQTQPALANEFLNIQHLLEKGCNLDKQDVLDVEHGCLPFVYTVLQGEGKNSQSVYEAVMCFVHTVWTEKCELVINILRSKEGFWTLFFTPLYQPRSYGWDVHKMVMNIIALEVRTCGRRVAPMLLDHLEIFFRDDPNVRVWFEVFENILVDNTESEFLEKQWSDAVSFFEAWKEFIILCLASFGLSESQKLMVYEYSVRMYMKTVGDFNKKEATKHIAELLAALMGNSHGDFIRNYITALQDLIQVLQKTAQFYNVIGTYTRSTISMFALELMQNVADFISVDTAASVSILDSVCEIVRKDLNHLPILIHSPIECEMEASTLKANSDTLSKIKEMLEEVKLCNLNITILQNLLLKLLNKRHLCSLIHRNKIFSMLLASTGDALQLPVLFDIAVSLMYILFLLATTPFSQSMVSCQIMDRLTLSLLPQRNKSAYSALLTGEFRKYKHWTCTKWPRVYMPALQMISVLLRTQKFFFLEAVITFVDCHIEYLVSSIISFRHTLSAELPKAAIHLVHELSKPGYKTRTNYFQNMDLLLSAVKYCLQSSIWLLIYPKHIHTLLKDSGLLSERESFQVSPALLSIQNDLLELIILCHQVLLHYSPDLHDFSTNDLQETVINKKLIVNLQATFVATKPEDQFQFLLEEDGKCLQNTSITFNLLTSLVNFCTAFITKMGRASYLSRPRHGVSYSGSFTSLWESSLNKQRVEMALEICLNLLLSQSMLVLSKPNITHIVKNSFTKFMCNELVSFVRLANTCFSRPPIGPALQSSVERMSVRTISSEDLLEDTCPSSSSLDNVEMLSVCSRTPSSAEMMSLVPNSKTFLEKVWATLPSNEKAVTDLTVFTENSNIQTYEPEGEPSKSIHKVKEDEKDISVTVTLPPKPLKEFVSSSDEEEEEEIENLDEQKGKQKGAVEDAMQEKVTEVNDEFIDNELSESFKFCLAQSSSSEMLHGMDDLEDTTEFLSLMAYFCERLFHINV